MYWLPPAVVFLLFARLAVQVALEALNRAETRLHSGVLPGAFVGLMDDATYAKSSDYTQAKSRFASFELFFDAAVLSIVLFSGALPWLWLRFDALSPGAAWSGAFFLSATGVLLSLPGLPLDWWSHFRLEEKFGFNKSTPGLWVVDQIKSMLLGLAIGFPLAWGLLALVRWVGPFWWVWGFALLFGFQLLMIVLYPKLILPLFNKLTPLAEGEQRTRLLALAERTGFQAQTIDVIDGSTPFRHELFGKPGVIAATAGELLPPELRQRGSQTVFFDMYLNKRIGTPTKPAAPAGLEAAAQKLFDYAVLSSGCATPLIAMNELFGASTPAPWTVTTAQYRQNVLQWARLLVARGAHPVLLISSEPFTGGDAGAWWRSLAEVSDIVLEKYGSAPALYKLGPIAASRRLRAGLRASASKLYAVGVPAARVGVMLGFQTKLGAGGREGLSPPSAWFEIAKLQTLAAKQVARELGFAHIWSWGWGHWNAEGVDPAKKTAACVWHWARDPALCPSAPQAAAGPGFSASLAEGQIDLPPTVRCTLGAKPVTTNAIGELAAVTLDAEAALSALYARLVESRVHQPSGAEVLAAELGVIRSRFGGSRTGYLGALRSAHATLAAARGVLGDELRRVALRGRLAAAVPAMAAIAAYYETFAEIDTRVVEVKPAPSWLPAGRGLVLASAAPAAVFAIPTGGARTIRTREGVFRVRAVGGTEPLGAIPLELVRGAIGRALRDSSRASAFPGWTLRQQTAALAEVRCTGDRLPVLDVVDLTAWLPFLAL